MALGTIKQQFTVLSISVYIWKSKNKTNTHIPLTYPSPLDRKHEGPAHIQRSPFPPRSSRCGILSLLRRERIPGVPVASQVEALSTGNARGTPESCHHSKSPLDVSVHSRGTCFPCTASTFTPRFDSHFGGMWDSPLG